MDNISKHFLEMFFFLLRILSRSPTSQELSWRGRARLHDDADPDDDEGPGGGLKVCIPVCEGPRPPEPPRPAVPMCSETGGGVLRRFFKGERRQLASSGGEASAVVRLWFDPERWTMETSVPHLKPASRTLTPRTLDENDRDTICQTLSKMIHLLMILRTKGSSTGWGNTSCARLWRRASGPVC